MRIIGLYIILGSSFYECVRIAALVVMNDLYAGVWHMVRLAYDAHCDKHVAYFEW
jgi:hypothetical protein